MHSNSGKYCNHGNQGMSFTVEEKQRKVIPGLKYKGSVEDK
jgi:hypothetical protein